MQARDDHGGPGWVLEGGEALRPEGWSTAPVGLAGGCFGTPEGARRADLSGWLLLPGIVDIHGDGFERHLAPRRGMLRDLATGFEALEAELAANGITTAVLAQFISHEGAMRGPEFAARMLAALEAHEAQADLRVQLRIETHFLDGYAHVRALSERHGVGYAVFNDHLPHGHLRAGKRPPRLTGQALKSGRNPEAYLAQMIEMEAQSGEVPGALSELAGWLSGHGAVLGSHDDGSAEDRARYRALGARIAEFPETRAAAEAARAAGDGIVLGAPNVVRGNSHAGNVSAAELIAEGLCDALASDYHYPAPRQAAFALAARGVLPLEAAWRLISEGPARLLGLEGRGRIAEGQRADLVIAQPGSGRIGAVFAAGRILHMNGEVAARLLAAA